MRDRLLATAARIATVVAMVAATLTAAVLAPATPAQAATADLWGFAYVDDPTVAVWTDLDHSRQWGTWKTAFPGLWAQGLKVAPGRFLVRFPQIGLGARGNVHVTPVNRTGEYCEIVRWGQSGFDEIVDVQCHKPGGAPADSRFTVLWTFSSGVLPAPTTSYASVQFGPGFIIQSYNSTGGAVTVAPGPVGQYNLRFVGVGNAAAHSGNLQVTALHPNASPRRCKVVRWGPAGVGGTDIFAVVFCFDQNGEPAASEFTASYHKERSVIASFAPPKYIGYISTAGVGETNFNYVAGGFGFNSVSPIPPLGRFLVKYPFLGEKETHAQVTAHGSKPNYCNLTQPWSQLGGSAEVDVICFDNAGAFTPDQFLTTFTSRI